MLVVAGETAIDERVFGVTAAVTVSAAFPLTPLKDADILVDPAPTAVTNPEGVTVATAVLAAVHFTVAVTSAVDPSL
jgi:hypothetical protein